MRDCPATTDLHLNLRIICGNSVGTFRTSSGGGCGDLSQDFRHNEIQLKSCSSKHNLIRSDTQLSTGPDQETKYIWISFGRMELTFSAKEKEKQRILSPCAVSNQPKITRGYQ
jgi:hypothetical protein